MNFSSDNAFGASPEIIEAIARANADALGSYGADPLAARVEERLKEIFGTDLRAFLVSTGTAANAITLASLSPPWGTVFCHEVAHIAEDECGAPEFYGGGLKLHLLPGAQARIDPVALSAALVEAGARGVHQAQPAALSLTNLTEMGALYTAAQLSELCAIAHAKGMAVHLDGTRFANALVAGNETAAAMSWQAGVDVLCLGATKNGALAAEVVIFFDPERQAARIAEFEFRRKRGGHLVSKGRLLSSQMDAYLTDDLWLRNARHANAMGQKIAAALAAHPEIDILNEPQANMIFARLPLAVHRRLREAGAGYYLEPASQTEDGDGEAVMVRLVCAPTTPESDIDNFLAICAGDGGAAA